MVSGKNYHIGGACVFHFLAEISYPFEEPISYLHK